MKKLALAASVALLPTFAEAQQVCLTDEQIKEQWNEITTDRVFLGLSDSGVAVRIFENPEAGRWSFWFTNAANPDVSCLFDQGSAADSVPKSFTTGESAPQEPNL